MKDPIETIDTFGYQLWDGWQNKNGIQLLERDDAMMDWGDAMQYFNEFKDWPAHIQAVVKKAQGRVLDIGCGAGRHSLYFQDQGLNITSIDVSKSILSLAEERGVNNTKLCSIDDLEKLNDQYDTIFLGGNGLGLLQSPERAVSILEKLNEITTADAQIIGDNQDPLITDDETHLNYHRLNKERGREVGHVTMRVRHRNYTSPWFDYWFFSLKRLSELVKNTNWMIKESFEGEEGAYSVVLTKSNPED